MKLFILFMLWHIYIKSSTQASGIVIDDTYEPDVPQIELFKLHPQPMDLFLDPRSKRSAPYKIIESPGLHSHFIVVQDEEILRSNPNRRRNRRSLSRSELHSDEIEDIEMPTRRTTVNNDDVSLEDIPQAEKQTLNPAYYRSDDSRLMDKWVKAPYGDFQSRSHKEEDDTQAEASSNIGTKARTPRVNFITQQGHNSGNKDDPDGPEAREREREKERERERERERDRDYNRDNNRDQQNLNKSPSDDGYRKPPIEPYYPQNYYNKKYDPYTPNYIPPYDHYGRHSYYYGRDPYRDMSAAPAYYPYRDRDLAYVDRPPAGMSRMTPPIGGSSSFYYRHQYNDYDDYLPRTVPNYYYSDKRFDIPTPVLPMEPRSPYERELYQPYLYTNEVNNRPGRIIYYANLPEIVRTPSNYRSATARYGDPGYNNYYYDNNYDDYKTARTPKAATIRSIPLSPATTTMRVSSAPVRSETGRERPFFG
ncbi:CLUMA_CG003879, isoform A [Clunio marinus]|uniref:CLUMA_CG003879, isoform A n=1 Tax=Clunio marinus TaxID=568069 RepID=A0A1J1HRZ9_9DIPT|nr:CLUMA_CG003879, isoform A [Clunio marinus]